MISSLDFSGRPTGAYGDLCGFGGGGDGLNSHGAGGGGGYSGGGNWSANASPTNNGFTYHSRYGGGGGGSYAPDGIIESGVNEGHGKLILRATDLAN
jgi:hypothetical protein